MHISRLLRYGILFAVLTYVWMLLFAYFIRIPLPSLLFYILQIPLLVVWFFIVAIFFSRTQPTFLRGIVLGAVLALTPYLLEAIFDGIPDLFRDIASGSSVWSAFWFQIEYGSSFNMRYTALLTVATGLIAILPQTELVARRAARQAQSY